VLTFTMELSKEFRERFIKPSRAGDYVLYGGLLELARQRGLKRIKHQGHSDPFHG